jgi:hypothetical protein
MLMLDTWEQTAVFNPADPYQKKIEANVGIPGGRATFYFNRVPNPGSLAGPTLLGPNLLGLRGLGFMMPSIGTIAKLGLVGLGAWLVGTKTNPGRKAVRKVKALLPGKR